MFNLILIIVAAALLLAVFVAGVIKGAKAPSPRNAPPAQPTESEAIVAAMEEGQRPSAAPPLAPPKMLPVDLAASLPPQPSRGVKGPSGPEQPVS